MPLQLTITSYHKITPGQRAEVSVNEGVLSIGRGADNDWVLPDPERLVSSRHCQVQYRDGHYYLTDTSTNGVELLKAGIRLRRGNSERLEHGEVIRLGDYEIEVGIEQASAAGFDLGGQGVESFEALLNPPPAPEPPRFPAQFEQASAMDTLPDLFDFLAPAAPTQDARHDHVPAEQHDFRPPQPLAPAPIPAPQSGAPILPEWDFLSDEPAPQAVPVPAPAVMPEQARTPPAPPPQQTLPPTPVAPAAPVPPAAQAAPAPAGDAVLQAFLRGARLEHLRIDAEQAAAQMEHLGRSYRLMVEGLIDVLRARSSLKGEFRMQQTTIQPLENNPLKFAPNADEALMLLLRHGNRAFMAPDEAVKDSFDDLRAHQLAVMAGVQAAIHHLLERFEPKALEARLAPAGGLSGLLSSRDARNWQQFTELYQNIAREAEDDFQDLFGREFSRAYEEQSARLRRE